MTAADRLKLNWISCGLYIGSTAKWTEINAWTQSQYTAFVLCLAYHKWYQAMCVCARECSNACIFVKRYFSIFHLSICAFPCMFIPHRRSCVRSLACTLSTALLGLFIHIFSRLSSLPFGHSLSFFFTILIRHIRTLVCLFVRSLVYVYVLFSTFLYLSRVSFSHSYHRLYLFFTYAMTLRSVYWIWMDFGCAVFVSFCVSLFVYLYAT